jgi:chromate transporter
MLTTLFNLFFSFLKVGLFSFGGAYSLIPLIETEVVENNKWLSPDEFIKILGMVEVIPGAISIKFATYTGYKAGGIAGAVAANLGNLLMPFVMILAAAYFYQKFEKNVYFIKAFNGIKFAVIGMIIAIMFQYLIKNYIDYRNIIFLLFGMSLIILFKLHPAAVVAAAGILALLIL